VNFYRGLWCSYCQRDLLGVEEILPDIRKANASVIAITHGLIDASSLRSGRR
jgi:peroxiredoxin